MSRSRLCIGAVLATVSSVRWETLFADLENQLQAAQDEQMWDEVPDLTRAERAGMKVEHRLRALRETRVRLGLLDGHDVQGRLADVGDGWLLVVDRPREHLVPLAAVATIRGAAAPTAPPPRPLERLGLAHALRALARDRRCVRVQTAAGGVLGRVDSVGADHLELGLVDEAWRPTGERQIVTFVGLRLVSAL